MQMAALVAFNDREPWRRRKHEVIWESF